MKDSSEKIDRDMVLDTVRFELRDALIAKGVKGLSWERITELENEIISRMTKGPCRWAFRKLIELEKGND